MENYLPNFGERVIRLWYAMGARAKLARALGVKESDIANFEKMVEAPSDEIATRFRRLEKRAAQAEEIEHGKYLAKWRGDEVGGRIWLNELLPHRIFGTDIRKS